MRKIVPIVRGLLNWFQTNARDLPWRRTRDPYAIWVSEIMLQQTQVKTVIPYWERWMAEMPTVQALAAAPLDRVLKLWEGLGYYTRARNLHRAAQSILAEHAGRFPQEFDDVLALPGVGRYTAGAVCSIAFNQPTPILDGNVIRVLARLFAISGNVRERRTTGKLWELAEALVQQAAREDKPRGCACSHLNQALMELGATLCTPRQPACASCPVQRHCEARRRGRVERLPTQIRRAASIDRQFVAFAVRHGGKFLVRQRPPGVINGHLWEFPNTEIRSAETNVQTLASKCLGFKVQKPRLLQTVRHTITRYRDTLRAYQTSPSRNLAPENAARHGRWMTLKELNALAFPSAHRQIVDRLLTSHSKLD